jgi:hypothetical protein
MLNESGSALYDRFHNYQAAFYTAALASVALVCELGARRPVVSEEPRI